MRNGVSPNELKSALQNLSYAVDIVRKDIDKQLKETLKICEH